MFVDKPGSGNCRAFLFVTKRPAASLVKMPMSSALDKVCIAIISVLLTGPALAGERDPALAGFFAAPLVIESTASGRHEFTVYLAITPYQRAHGLMFVRTLPGDHGMLFVHQQPKIARMWMKNTVLSLDMLFIRADGIISSIVHDTVPGSLKSIVAMENVTGVLELNAGTAKRLNLAAGDRIVYRAFQPKPTDAKSPASDPH